MSAYIKKIKRRMILAGAVICASVGLSVYDVIAATSTQKAGMAYSFNCGMLAAFGLFALFMLFYYSRALKDKKLLKKAYNKENDERMKSIRAKAGIPVMLIASLAVLFSGIVASYFNEVVSMTLMAVGMLQLLFSVISKRAYLSIG